MRDRDRCSVTNPPECGDGPAPRITGRAAALGKAFAEGHVTEGEAEALAALIEARQVGSPKPADQGDVGKSDAALNRLASPRMDSTPLIHLRLACCAFVLHGGPTRRRTAQHFATHPRMGRSGSRPRTDASMERRR